MRQLRTLLAVSAAATTALVVAACGSGGGSSTTSGAAPTSSGGAASTSATGAPATLLDKIKADGVLRVSTDPAYPPQSSFDEATGEWTGFDIDVATEIATRMGVTVKWETPSWDLITAGNWQDRWDLSVGSMTVTAERAEVLDFTTPYYYTPAGLAVQEGSDITSIDQLAGKRVGTCGACSYDFYLQRSLNIPGYNFEYLVPQDIEIVTYDTDSTGIQDLVVGRVDAMMSAVPTLEEAIKKGRKIKLLGDPVFLEPLAAAVDKNATLPVDTFVAELNTIIQGMHEDGTLSELSMKYYGVDLTKGPGA